MEASYPETYYLSTLLARKVLSAEGKGLGKALDLLVELDRPQPEVVKLVFRHSWSSERWCAKWSDVASMEPARIRLKSGATPSPLADGIFPSSQILLRDFLLDKQIVDVHGAKVERVNDLQFVRSDGKLMLVQVDVGLRGLLRRLGFEGPVIRFTEWFFDYTPKEKFIAWNYVQPLSDPDRLRLQIPQSKLSDLHPADLADIIEDMDVHERAVVVESLNEEVLADALEEMDPKVQVSIMRGLEPEKAADILEEMSPDEAADLIADLPTDTARGILREMDGEYQATVKGLLAHEEDEAGGLMSTQFMALPPDKTIVDALAARQAECASSGCHLLRICGGLGVQAARGRQSERALSHEIFTPFERIMTRRIVTAKTRRRCPGRGRHVREIRFQSHSGCGRRRSYHGRHTVQGPHGNCCAASRQVILER